MNYEDIIKELREMRNHYDSGFSSLERQRIGELYQRILGKQITNMNCPDCYKDAFIETFTTLQRLGKLPEEKHYKLKDGKVLHVFGTSQYLFDVNDEQAETFLAQFPQLIDSFAKYPEDWQERVEKRKAKKNRKKTDKK